MLMSTAFWNLSHDDTSGRPRLSDQALRLGLAASLLSDLVLKGFIHVTDSAVHSYPTDSPEDDVYRSMVDHLRREHAHRHTPRIWLEWFARNSITVVAEQMTAAGLVRADKHRSLFGRTTTTYVPLNPLESAGTRALLSLHLARMRDLDREWGTLAALAWACGMDGELLESAPSDAAGHLRISIRTSPPEGCRELAYAVKAIIGDRVLAGQ